MPRNQKNQIGCRIEKETRDTKNVNKMLNKPGDVALPMGEDAVEFQKVKNQARESLGGT